MKFMESQVVWVLYIFKFEQLAFERGQITGRIVPTGIHPQFMDRIERAGIHLPASIFGISGRR